MFNRIYFYIKKAIDLSKHKSGAVFLEFGLVLPVLVTLFFGSLEVSNMIYVSQKNQTFAYMVANLVASQDDLTTQGIEDAKTVASQIVNSIKSINQFKKGVRVSIIQKSSSRNDVAPYRLFVFYQYNNHLGNASPFSYSRGSQLEVDNSYVMANVLSPIEVQKLSGYNFAPGEQIIVVETDVDYTAPIFNILGAKIAPRFAYTTTPIRPRAGAFRFLANSVI